MPGRYLDLPLKRSFEAHLFPRSARELLNAASVPIGLVVSVATAVAMLRSGYHIEIRGIPGEIIAAYETVRDLILSPFPQSHFTRPTFDAVLFWLFFATTNYKLLSGRRFCEHIERLVDVKERMISHEGANDVDPIKGEQTILSDRVVTRAEGSRLFAYPWLFRQWWIWVILGPAIYFVMLYKVFFPAYLADDPIDQRVIHKFIIRDTILLWSVLFLASVNVAAVLYWSQLQRFVAS